MEFMPINNSAQIFEEFYSTGEMGVEVKEQSLIFKGKKANIFAGCSHPGILNIVKKVKGLYGDIGVVIGGFHLLHKEIKEVEKIADEIKSIGVEKIYPTHCTGDIAKSIFKKVFGKMYGECGAGLELEVM